LLWVEIAGEARTPLHVEGVGQLRFRASGREQWLTIPRWRGAKALGSMVLSRLEDAEDAGPDLQVEGTLRNGGRVVLDIAPGSRSSWLRRFRLLL